MKWTAGQIRNAVELLEGEYGEPRFISRFDPMEELVSCILSQHTTDATSFPTFASLRAAVPSWEQLASMSPEEVVPLIRKAGLPNQKARSILGCLREIHRRTGEYSLEVLRQMPTEEARAWLASLQGVGPKTAAIVLCFSFGRATIPVDTHVFRVSWRLGLIDPSIGEAKAHSAIEQKVPSDLAFRFHTALIQHGRHTCRARNPLCDACVLRRKCRFYKECVA